MSGELLKHASNEVKRGDSPTPEPPSTCGFKNVHACRAPSPAASHSALTPCLTPPAAVERAQRTGMPETVDQNCFFGIVFTFETETPEEKWTAKDANLEVNGLCVYEVFHFGFADEVTSCSFRFCFADNMFAV
jgi:hypothetical protein